jgi:serine/threonine-protein kinase
MSHDFLPAATTLQNGHFVLREVIGRGGSGITYAARDTRLQRDVAVKEFFPPGCTRQNREVNALDQNEYSRAKAGFVEEARSLARFDHPHILRAYMVFEENNSAYLVTELLRGKSLQELVEEDGALSEAEALHFMEPVCKAVEAVHRASLLHQDIKPANIMACDDGRVVLLDFGLTRTLPVAALSTVMLSPHIRFGTVGYSPLEQYSRLAQVGTYTDVYALAATLWHLLTGTPPPDAPDRASGAALPDIRVLVPGLNDATMRVLKHGLEMNPDQRAQSVQLWWQDLVQAQRAHSSLETTQIEPRQVGSLSLVEQEWGTGSPWSLILFAGSLFALLAAMMLWR